MRGIYTKRVAMLSVAALLAGCATVKQESFKLSTGQIVDYIHGKVAGDGQEGIFRDAYVDGKPVLSHFGSGQSLLGQVLQGTASSAMIAGGMVGGAALLRPAQYKNKEINVLDNDQSQGQLQGQQQGQETTSVAVSESTSKATNSNTNVNSAVNSNKNSNTAVNANSNHNHNHNSIKVEDIGGGSGGGVPGCQKAKNGC